MNSLWTITYGGYQLAVDRRTLTYSLTETKTNTVWADGLSLGWMEIKDRASGEISRHDFGTMKIFSVSEKAGHQGKRILFGLDCQGIPVDIYVISSEREIQIVLESNRDSKTHTVEGFGLCPGLCAVPGGDSYLVIPNREGAIVNAKDVPSEPLPLPIWSGHIGVAMPFVGAVRFTPQGNSLLTLVTDSAYGSFTLQRTTDTTAQLDTRYSRDPERRRLDLRILCQSGGDYITIARNYREKIISDRNHRTIRQKLQDHPDLESLTGSVLYHLADWDTGESVLKLASELRDLHPPDHSIFLFAHSKDHACSESDFETTDRKVRELGYQRYRFFDGTPGGRADIEPPNRWEFMEEQLLKYAANDEKALLGSASLTEWAVIATDFTVTLSRGRTTDDLVFPRDIPCRRVPLVNAVYHDCLISHYGIDLELETESQNQYRSFLNALLLLNAPLFRISQDDLTNHDSDTWNGMRRVIAILSPLHRLAFSAFLTAHRFLTPDFTVEEAMYSDKTRIVINQSDTETYPTDDLHLPPFGFYVRHRQMEAFDALRIGDKEYPTRAWRVARSRDGKPLEQSQDVLHLEFPIP